MKKVQKNILTILSVLSFTLAAFLGAVYYLGGCSHLYYSQAVITDICIFFAIALLTLALLIAIIVMMYKGKKVAQIVCKTLLVLFIPLALLVSFLEMVYSTISGPNGCSYTEDIANYGRYDNDYSFPHFPDSITDDMTVVKFTYFYKYIDLDQTDIYLEVKFKDKETMDEYLTIAKNSFKKGFITYKNPYDPKYTDIVDSNEEGYPTSYILFSKAENYKYVDMQYSSITYSYDDLTIIYNDTSIGNDIEMGNNPDQGEYYPTLLERLGVEWDANNDFTPEYIEE